MGEAGHERTPAPPPHDDDAERSLLGAILLDQAALPLVLAEGVTASDFYAPARAAVFDAMISARIAGLPVDVVTVTHRLRSRGKLDAAGGPAELARLLDAVPVAADAPAYARIVRDLSVVRALASTCRFIAARCYTEHADVRALIESSSRAFYAAIGDRMSRSRSMTFAQITDEAFREMSEAANAPERIAGLPTGLRGLDGYLGGLQESDLVIIAGRPSLGKTSLATQIAVQAAAKHGTRVLMFSIESSRGQIARRMLSEAANIDGSKLRRAPGKADREAWTALVDACGRLSTYPGRVEDAGGGTQGHIEIAAEARRVAAEDGPIGLVVVDYLQLMRAPRGADSREQAVAENARAMKSLAKELRAPVILLSQLSRRVEQRGAGARPMLSDLRESGSVEQDADVVIFLHRDGAADDPNVDLIVAKHRNGPVGTAHAHFNARVTRFSDVQAWGQE